MVPAFPSPPGAPRTRINVCYKSPANIMETESPGPLIFIELDRHAGLTSPVMPIPIQKVITYFNKSQTFYAKKRKKRKPANSCPPASGIKRDNRIRSYFVLTGLASFTTRRTGYWASESGMLYIVPVRIDGESAIAVSAGSATEIASPSFLP